MKSCVSYLVPSDLPWSVPTFPVLPMSVKPPAAGQVNKRDLYVVFQRQWRYQKQGH